MLSSETLGRTERLFAVNKSGRSGDVARGTAASAFHSLGQTHVFSQCGRSAAVIPAEHCPTKHQFAFFVPFSFIFTPLQKFLDLL